MFCSDTTTHVLSCGMKDIVQQNVKLFLRMLNRHNFTAKPEQVTKASSRQF